MSYTSVEHITELSLDRLPIDWSKVSEEALAELQQHLEHSTQQQLADLEEDRQAVQTEIRKSMQQAEQVDGVPIDRNLLEQ
jgi:C4-dicarboxylate-specific signal transduction histidine kinase